MTGRWAIEEALGTRPRSRPGEVFGYANVNTNILSTILTDQTGMSASDYARRYLFEPLGIRSFTWAQRDQYSDGAGGLSIATRDLARIGYLVLKRGQWDGRRIVSERWIEESTGTQAATGETYRGKPIGYGYLWWLHEFSGYRAITAYGFGGQFVTVLPDLDLVIAMTGEREASGDREDIIPDVIIPAVVGR